MKPIEIAAWVLEKCIDVICFVGLACILFVIGFLCWVILKALGLA
jgi:isoprenylcysteine carboxyl methyltransferase (ICMT) family protein YpbQ